MKASVVMMMLAAVVLALLLPYGRANCGCLKCCKNLFVASPPGAPVKIIYRRGPGIQAQDCDGVISKPYSVNVQAPLSLPLPVSQVQVQGPLQLPLPVSQVQVQGPLQLPLPVSQVQVQGPLQLPLPVSQVPVAYSSVPAKPLQYAINQYQVLPSYIPPLAYQPHVPRAYEVKIQAPVTIPALVKDICVPKPIKAVARVDRIVMPEPAHVPAPVPLPPTVYTRPLLPLLPAQYPIIQQGCAPVKTVVPEVRPIGTPIIETLVPDASAPYNYRCRYDHLQISSHQITPPKHSTDTYRGNSNLDDNPFHLDSRFLSNLKTPSTRTRRSIKYTDVIRNLKEHNYNLNATNGNNNVNNDTTNKERNKRHIPLISSGIHFLMGFLPAFLTTSVHQGFKSMKQHADQTLADQISKRKMQHNIMSPKMTRMYNPQVSVPQSDYRQTPHYSQLREFPQWYPNNRQYDRDMYDLHSPLKHSNYIPQISGRSKYTQSKMQDLVASKLKSSNLFDNLERRSKKELTPKERQIFLKKLQKLNGAPRRHKRSLVLDTSDIALPFFRVTRVPDDEVENSIEELSTEEETGDDYWKQYSQEEEEEEDSPSKNMLQYRKKYPHTVKRKERLLEPLDFNQLIPLNPIFYLLNIPIRLLQHVHSIREQIAPVLKSVPKVLLNSKKYLKDFGKSFHREFLDMTSNMIGDFDDDPYVYNRLDNVITSSRYRRSLANTDKFISMDGESSPLNFTQYSGDVFKQNATKEATIPKRCADNFCNGKSKETETKQTNNSSLDLTHRLKKFASISVQKELLRNHSNLSEQLGKIHPFLKSVLERVDGTRNVCAESIKNYSKSIKTVPFQLLLLIFKNILQRNIDNSHEELDDNLNRTTSVNNNNEQQNRNNGHFRPEYSIVPQNNNVRESHSESEMSINRETTNIQDNLLTVHTRSKRHIRPTLASNLASSDEDRTKSTRREYKNCCKHHLGENIGMKLRKEKHLAEKLYPSPIIDNTGSGECSCKVCKIKSNDKESHENDPSSKENNFEETISNVMKTAKQHADSQGNKCNTVGGSEDKNQVSKYSDVSVQIIKKKIGRTLTGIQNLITMDFHPYTTIFKELSKLEHQKLTVSDEWRKMHKADDMDWEMRLLKYIEIIQMIKDDVVEKIAQSLKRDYDFMTRKLIKMLIRLQKLQCIIYRLGEMIRRRHVDSDSQKELTYLDYLSSLNFAMKKSRDDLEEDLKKERDEAVERNRKLVDELRHLELRGDRYVINDEAKLLWEMKNLEKLQQVTISALNNKIQRKQNVRKELKILFELLEQVEIGEEKQEKLFRTCKKFDNRENYFKHGIPRIENRIEKDTVHRNM